MTLPQQQASSPRFAKTVPLVRPTVELDDELFQQFREVLESGMLTNHRHVKEFENAVAALLGVEHVVAVSNCTTGLMMVLRCLDLRGDIILPSFTFMATGHAADWNGNGIRLADSHPDTWTIDPASVAELADGSAGVMAMHTFGAPCDIDELEQLCTAAGIPLIIDAAHGFGSRYPDGSMVGTKGTAEVFSLSPTKTLSTAEGGLITTNDADLAARLSVAREYGNPGDYDSRFIGLNGRMNELSALLGLSAIKRFPHWIEVRRTLAERYRTALEKLPGLQFQSLAPGAASSYKDLGIRVTAQEFGMTRDELAERLRQENVTTRSYFDPALHQQTAYQHLHRQSSLTVTEQLASTMITLPLYSHMPAELVDEICALVTELHSAS
ncbi:DegT/DnrJ/EryC1/StrS family aminotransferase [Streptomyces sp. NPDC059894]|uniref:DegT/DnrJ/EryC1/StrS family aminotransferase n=1 Tax=unclassified Streptomyces TaxID=2593676 RepID=UPI003664870D